MTKSYSSITKTPTLQTIHQILYYSTTLAKSKPKTRQQKRGQPVLSFCSVRLQTAVSWMMTSSFLARAGGPWQRCRGQTSTAPIAETARASVAAVEAGRPTHRRARRAAIFQGQVLNPSLLLLFLKRTPQRFLLTAVRTARVVSASRFLGHRAPGRSHHRHCVRMLLPRCASGAGDGGARIAGYLETL